MSRFPHLRPNLRDFEWKEQRSFQQHAWKPVLFPQHASCSESLSRPLMRAVLHLPHWPQTNAMNHYILWNTDLYNTIRPPSNAIHYTHLSVPHFIRQEIFWLAGAIRRRMDWLITAALIWYCHHATNQWPRMFSCVFQVCFGLNELLANFSLA